MVEKVILSRSNTSRRKIGIVYERELDVGGVEAHLLSIFQNCRDGCIFEVFSPVSDRFRKKASTSKVRFHPICRFPPLDVRIIFSLIRKFKQEKLDLVHIHSPVAAIPGRLAAKFCGLPVIVTVHCPASYYYGHRTTLRASFGRFLYINLDRVFNYFLTDRLIFVSQRLFIESTSHHLAPANKSVVIPNGIDLVRFQQSLQVEKSAQELRNNFRVSNNEMIMTFSGRIDEDKGIDLLIEALTYLDSVMQNKLRVWLVGSGPHEAHLKAMTQSAGLQHMIVFLGYQERVEDLLLASDIFVLPSLYEAMPISLLEAIAAGLPCIVTDVGDNALVVENNVQGLVIPPNDPKALARAIQRMISDANFRSKCGEKSREKAAMYEQRLTFQQVEGIYDDLLVQRNR